MTDPQEFDTKQVDPNARKRSVGRELAMKLVYMLDIRGPERAFEGATEIIDREDDVQESQEFGRQLFDGVASTIDSIDAVIRESADNWQISRMANIDRALLRIGTYELLYCFDIPPKVTISEAIELSKKYSTEKSSSFINGILDKIFQQHCADKV